MRIGVAHHLGWAVAVTADDDHRVVDRRRVELVDAGLPNAPIHHLGGAWDLHRAGEPPTDEELATKVAEVRASVVRSADAAFDALATAAGALRLREPQQRSLVDSAPWVSRWLRSVLTGTTRP